MPSAPLLEKIRTRWLSSALLKGFAANLYGQVVTTAVVLGSVPIYLAHWGVERYGAWVLMTAIPSYLSSCDFGIGAAATNQMLIKRPSDTDGERDAIFQSALVGISSVSALLLVLSALATWIAGTFFGYGHATTVFLLAALSCTTLFTGCLDAALRANGRIASSIYFLNSIRLAEALGGIGALIAWDSFVAVAGGMLAVRITFTVAGVLRVSSAYPSPKWGCAATTRAAFASLYRPALSFAVYPVANGLILQGVTFVLGVCLGAPALVMFTCYRTVTRLVTQALTLVNRTFWPELSLAFGRGDGARFSALMARSQDINVIISAIAAAGAIALAPWVIRVWTHGKVAYAPVFFNLMVLSTFLTSLWQAKWVALMSINKHGRFSIYYLALSFLLLPLTWMLAHVFAELGGAVALIAHETALCFADAHAFRKTSNDFALSPT
jgi:O-antigen/teichoic acid export membrane protein